MLRLTPLLLAVPLALSLGISAPAKAECSRYRVWDSDRDSYAWQYNCTRSDRNYDAPYFHPHRYSRNNLYWLLGRHRDWRYRNDPWNSRYERDWRHDNNRWDWDYNGNRRYDKNPTFRIFLGF
jgi:hypothetical protein